MSEAQSITYLPENITLNPNFVGRQAELREMDDILLPEKPLDPYYHVRSLTLNGIGGSGKTELAIKYLHSRSEHFAEVCWIDSSENQLETHFERIKSRLGLIDDYNFQPNSRRLFIFDDLDKPHDIQPLLKFFKGASVIVTSRNLGLILHLRERIISLKQLLLKDAAELFHQRLRPNEPWTSDVPDYEIITALPNRLGRFPLAIMQEAAFINMRNLSPTEYVRRYPNGGPYTEIREATDEDLRSRYRKTLATILDIGSFSIDSAGLLAILSNLHSDRIVEKMFLFNHGRLDSEYYSARVELQNASIIDNEYWGAPLYTHRVIQEEFCITLSQTRRAELFQFVSDIVIKTWEEWELQREPRLQLKLDLLPHVENLIRIWSENSAAWSNNAGRLQIAAFLRHQCHQLANPIGDEMPNQKHEIDMFQRLLNKINQTG